MVKYMLANGNMICRKGKGKVSVESSLIKQYDIKHGDDIFKRCSDISK